MKRELCIVHANCQGEPLIERLEACPEFAQQYECRLFTNYIREPIPDELMERCSLFLYQHLESKWGDLASEHLLSLLPGSARNLCIPNMFFLGYWPLWSGEPGFNYRDTYLDSLIDCGLSGEEVLTLFLRMPLASKFDFGELLGRTLEREREREKLTPVKYVDMVEQGFRKERLFNTVNHPGPKLLGHVAAGVLEQLGYQAPEELCSMPDAFPEFEQPIHPQVAAFHGLEFAGPDAVYEVYGRKMSFAAYAGAYVEARQAGETDFIAWLMR